MAHYYKNLRTQLIVSVVIIILVLSTAIFQITVSEGKVAIKEQMREELTLLADVMARQVDGDVLQMINSEDDTENSDFMYIYEQLNDLRGNITQIQFIYTVGMDRGGNIRFLVDGDYLYDNLTPEVLAWELYEDAPVVDIKKGLQKSWATRSEYTDEWGTYMSGFAPIKNSDGETIGALGIDMNIATVRDKQEFLSSLVYYIAGMSIIIAIISVVFFLKFSRE